MIENVVKKGLEYDVFSVIFHFTSFLIVKFERITNSNSTV